MTDTLTLFFDFQILCLGLFESRCTTAKASRYPVGALRQGPLFSGVLVPELTDALIHDFV